MCGFLVCFGKCFWGGIGGLGKAVVVVVFIAPVINYHGAVLAVGCLVGGEELNDRKLGRKGGREEGEGKSSSDKNGASEVFMSSGEGVGVRCGSSGRGSMCLWEVEVGRQGKKGKIHFALVHSAYKCLSRFFLFLLFLSLLLALCPKIN